MRTIERSSAFKRDYKRAKAKPRHSKDVDSLVSTVVALLPSPSLSGVFLCSEQAGAILKIRRPTMASLDWSQCPAVESIPGKVSGAWVLRGTRMPVAAIFENIEAGANIDDIMEWFDGLDREQVKAVIEFAVRSLDKAPAYVP
jgi:uncharacterized protein (DUF433 family)